MMHTWVIYLATSHLAAFQAKCFTYGTAFEDRDIHSGSEMGLESPKYSSKRGKDLALAPGVGRAASVYLYT